jgi:hypothetical protein
VKIQDLSPGDVIRATVSVPGLFGTGDEFLVHDELSIDGNSGARLRLDLIADLKGELPFERSGYETPAALRYDLVALVVALLALLISTIAVLT